VDRRSGESSDGGGGSLSSEAQASDEVSSIHRACNDLDQPLTLGPDAAPAHAAARRAAAYPSAAQDPQAAAWANIMPVTVEDFQRSLTVLTPPMSSPVGPPPTTTATLQTPLTTAAAEDVRVLAVRKLVSHTVTVPHDSDAPAVAGSAGRSDSESNFGKRCHVRCGKVHRGSPS
jgi:hypothetical protein